MTIPKYDELFNPVLESIKKLGGSASISELDEEVTKNLHLADKDIAEAHDGVRVSISLGAVLSKGIRAT